MVPPEYGLRDETSGDHNNAPDVPSAVVAMRGLADAEITLRGAGEEAHGLPLQTRVDVRQRRPDRRLLSRE